MTPSATHFLKRKLRGVFARGPGESSPASRAEQIVAFFALVCFGCYCYFGLPLLSPLSLYGTRIGTGLLIYIFALLISLLLVRLRAISASRATGQRISWSESWKLFRLEYVNSPELLTDLRLVNLTAVLFVAFIHVKHLIPVVNPHALVRTETFDQLFTQSETMIFGGRLLGVWLTGWLGGAAAGWLSSGYTLFYPYVAVVVYCFILSRTRELTKHFFTAFALVWFVGIAVVFVLPTWGPCFYLPEDFASLPRTEMSALQERLVLLRSLVAEPPIGTRGIWMISGFPSLHLAIVVLGSICLWPLSKAMAVLSWIFALITAIATLYFGWHYLLDDIGAVVLATTCYLIANVEKAARPNLQ